MTATEKLILEQLAAINRKLEYLIVPVAKQAGRQMANMTNDERKAANKAAREQAKLMIRGK